MKMASLLSAFAAVALAIFACPALALTPLEMLSTNQYSPAIPNPTGVCETLLLLRISNEGRSIQSLLVQW